MCRSVLLGKRQKSFSHSEDSGQSYTHNKNFPKIIEYCVIASSPDTDLDIVSRAAAVDPVAQPSPAAGSSVAGTPAGARIPVAPTGRGRWVRAKSSRWEGVPCTHRGLPNRARPGEGRRAPQPPREGAGSCWGSRRGRRPGTARLPTGVGSRRHS